MALPPSEDMLRLLEKLKIGCIKDNKWTFDPEFERTALSIKQSPPSYFEAIKIANKSRDEIIPLMMTHGIKIIKTKVDRDNLVVAYTMYDRHMGRNKKLKFTDFVPESRDIPNILFTIFMLNLADIPVEEG